MLYLPDCPACMAHADNGNFGQVYVSEFQHGETVDADDSSNAVMNVSECEWVNEECPELCRTEHDEPEPDDDGMWSCPETGARYHYCVGCGFGWEPHGTWDSYPTIIDGEWYCDPYEHGYTSCEHCDEYRSEDSMHTIETGYDHDEYVCGPCYRAWRREQRERNAPPAASVCRTCNTPEVHLDLLTERFVCQHVANELRDKRKPILVAA